MVLAEQVQDIELVIIQTSENSVLGVSEKQTIYTVSFKEGWKIQVQSHRQSLLRAMGLCWKAAWKAAGQ